MSTQYNDQDTPDRVSGLQRHNRPRPTSTFDHQRLALDWLSADECIPALRVVDPGRGRFSPFEDQAEAFDPAQCWTPCTARRPRIDQLFIDCRRLLKVHGDWIVWRKPYSHQE